MCEFYFNFLFFLFILFMENSLHVVNASVRLDALDCHRFTKVYLNLSLLDTFILRKLLMYQKITLKNNKTK